MSFPKHAEHNGSVRDMGRDPTAGRADDVVEWVREPVPRDVAEAAARLLGPGGSLSKVLSGFESRPQQVQMAVAVSRVLADGGVGLIEAGTGTGKSLAYLAPAALYAKARRQRVIVSTHTHHLQEQLLRDDIPTLQAALAAEGGGDRLEAAVLKGWTNYVCLWRLGQVELGQQQLFPDHRQTMEQLSQWCQKDDHAGTREDVGFYVPDAVWEEVHAESDTCVRQRCPFYDECFYFRARRKAQAADVVIANHHLVCADFAVRHQAGWDTDVGVLPRSHHIVFDEAHHLEDVFTQHFGLSFSRLRINRLLRRIQGRSGVVPRLQRMVARHPDGDEAAALASTMTGAVPKAVAAVQTDSDGFFAHVARLAREASVGSAGPDGASTRRGSVPLARGMVEAAHWQALGSSLEALHTALIRLAEQLRAWQGDAPDQDTLAWEIEALARRADAAASDLAALAETDDRTMVYWLEPQGRGLDEWALRGAPIEVGPVVQETLLTHVNCVVMTSATLSAADEFQFFKQRLGLDAWPGLVAARSISSPFDYERQVLLCVADDLPAPEHPSFWASLAEALKRWLRASGGRAFVLFTSHRALHAVHELLSPWLQEAGMTPLRQNDMSRARLLERFRLSDKPVLFGTDSFWEGVDVPGDALSLVVVTRLPFRVPTDPVATARREALHARGLDPFDQLTVPQAVMRLRQGFGRLIRTARDRGAVVIADHRIVSRAYGRRFLDALPRTARHRGGAVSVATAVADWLSRPIP